MNIRERFKAIMNYEPFDRLPVWYFGTWAETKERWEQEGLEDLRDLESEDLMDPDWERDKWNWFGLVLAQPFCNGKSEVLEEGDTYRIVKDPMGKIIKRSTVGSSIPQTLEYPLKPTRESWSTFRKYLDPADPGRRPEGWEARADELEKRTDRIFPLSGGSLFGWPGRLPGTRACRAGMRLQADQGSRAEVVASALHRGSDNEEMHSKRTRSYGL